MKKIAIVALAAAATFITSCDIERMPYDKYTDCLLYTSPSPRD